MEHYLITQTLVAAWAYTFDCFEGGKHEAQENFMRALRREVGEQTEAMKNGIAFEREVYKQAWGVPRQPHAKWETGIQAVAERIKGAPTQVKVRRELKLDGMTFLVYGILDALKAGTIYDVKFFNKKMKDFDVYGKYLNSPQHPFYFYMVPEAKAFQYLLSDGSDLYVENYWRTECRPAEEIIGDFISSITGMGLLNLYKEKWQAL